MGLPDHYAVLGVTPGTPLCEIKRAYHEIARACHPDRVEGRLRAGAEPSKAELARAVATASKQLVQANAAFEVLGDSDMRAEYDYRLAHADELEELARQAAEYDRRVREELERRRRQAEERRRQEQAFVRAAAAEAERAEQAEQQRRRAEQQRRARPAPGARDRQPWEHEPWEHGQAHRSGAPVPRERLDKAARVLFQGLHEIGWL